MARPTDWSPLADSDPLPGDPVEISVEARYLKTMAEEMRNQISRLRAVGNDDELVGRYADKLRTASSDLAGKLAKTLGRFEVTSGELGFWSDELDSGQAETVQALHRAKAAEQQQLANAMALVPADPGSPTPYELGAEKRRQAALDEAIQDLKIAREQFHNAVDTARSQGSRHADRVREAIDDEVADSAWDDFKGWVDRNADWIKTVCDILGKIGMVLAVISLFIPGLNILTAIGMGIALGSLLGHTALAASGNGSWVDVGLDAFALATLGVGRAAASSLRGVQNATRAAAARTARRTAERAALRSTRETRTAAGRVLSSRTATAAERRGARRTIDAAKRDAQTAGSRAARDVDDAPLPPETVAQRLRAGSGREAQEYEDIVKWRREFPGNERIAQASRKAETYRNRQAAASWSDVATSTGDQGGEWGFGSYKDFKGHSKKEIGSTW